MKNSNTFSPSSNALPICVAIAMEELRDFEQQFESDCFGLIGVHFNFDLETECKPAAIEAIANRPAGMAILDATYKFIEKVKLATYQQNGFCGA